MQKSWISGRRAAPDTVASRLFCFSHAGGGSALYAPWRAAFGPGIEVCPVLLPGREARMSEPAYRRMEDLIDPLVAALEADLELPFSLFGHSMGSIVAFELARRLAALGYPLQSLMVSGRRAPHLRSAHAPVHTLDNDGFIDAIGALGGTPDEVLRDQGLFRTFLPSLRADFELNERYLPLIGHPLRCRLLAFSGDADAQVTESELLAWREVSAGSFSHHMLPGNHFYLQGLPLALRELIARHLHAHHPAPHALCL